MNSSPAINSNIQTLNLINNNPELSAEKIYPNRFKHFGIKSAQGEKLYQLLNNLPNLTKVVKEKDDYRNYYVIRVAKEFSKNDLKDPSLPFELSVVFERNSRHYTSIKFDNKEDKSKINNWLEKEDAILNALQQSHEHEMVLPDRITLLILNEEVENFVNNFKETFKTFFPANFDIEGDSVSTEERLCKIEILSSSNVSLEKLQGQINTLVNDPTRGILQADLYDVYQVCRKMILSDAVDELLNKRQQLQNSTASNVSH